MNDLTGQTFERLTVMFNSRKDKRGNALFACLCNCGNIVETWGFALKSGHTKSCGCLRKERALEKIVKHGDYQTRLYHIWEAMKARCYNSNSKPYKRYGGRGIKICEEWKDSYPNFKFWAIHNGYQDNLTIDRIDNNGNYEPHNCHFISREKNQSKGSLLRWKEWRRNQ